MTLALPKTGLARTAERLLLADIGIPAPVFDEAGVEYTSPFKGSYVVEITREAPR